MIYSGEHKTVQLRGLFPICFYDEQGNKQSVSITGEIKRIRFSEDSCVVLPWNRKRLVSGILYLSKTDFKYDKNNHMAYYYPELDVAYIYNGTHSASIGVAKRSGEIDAQVIDIEPLFKHIYTDGEMWFSKYNHSRLCAVPDFRVAVLFEMAKRRKALKEGERI